MSALSWNVELKLNFPSYFTGILTLLVIHFGVFTGGSFDILNNFIGFFFSLDGYLFILDFVQDTYALFSLCA